ncbi:MAG: EF-Tu/IF-2/RF-3 family GTPase [Planctomycetes bacterium]|nr:EF-Tu/IF-2/RF-3 family GTPase [Planctomycetota bacterium]
MPEEEIGKVSKFFNKIGVAVIKLEKGTLKPGDSIHVKGNTSDVAEKVPAMQVSGADVAEAKAGDEVGVKLSQKVRPNDKVFKVTPG